MTVDEAFERLESPGFAQLASQASGLTHFGHILATEEAFNDLLRGAQHADTQARLLKRILALSALEADPRYENPNDASLAAYVSILNHVAPHLALIAAESVTRTRGFWWARKLGEQALFGEPARTRTGDAQQVLGQGRISRLDPQSSSGDGFSVARLLPGRRAADRSIWPRPHARTAAA